jgi:hypothetical protein
VIVQGVTAPNEAHETAKQAYSFTQRTRNHQGGRTASRKGRESAKAIARNMRKDIRAEISESRWNVESNETSLPVIRIDAMDLQCSVAHFWQSLPLEVGSQYRIFVLSCASCEALRLSLRIRVLCVRLYAFFVDSPPWREAVD